MQIIISWLTSNPDEDGLTTEDDQVLAMEDGTLIAVE
jgi:hypothetical protein